MTSLIGTTVSHYRILERLGGGGMGIVYKAQDVKLDRPVALKFLPPDLTRDHEAKQRFIHEAKAASALQHNNICVVYDIDEADDGQLFISMECLEGETLKEKIERGMLNTDEALEIAAQVSQGLVRAHEQGIVHRDIKPSNIMLTSDGVAKIFDFGLAKLSGRTMLTKTGSTLGTAAYMSPEQARGEEVDTRTDIWSLGVVLYEMLTGRRPFDSEYDQALVYSILNEDPKPMREMRPEVPEELEKIVRRAMAKKLEDRYKSAAEYLSDIGSYRAGTDLSKQTRRVSARRRRGIYLVLGSAIAVIVATLVLIIPGRGEAIDSVAVLPFINVSRDPTLEWMCDGLTDEVIGDLCRTPGFSRVIAFNSVMEFKNKETSPEEVRRKLGVVAVLVTRLYQHGDQVSVSTELLNAKGQTRLWGNKYSHKASEINRLHSEIATGVTRALNLAGRDTASGALPQHPTDNPDAYRLFLQGQLSYHRLDEKELHRSISLFHKALELDPNMGTAYAGIAAAYCQLAGSNNWARVADSARAAAITALSLDRNLSDAHLALGMIRFNDFERFAAEEEFRTALRLNPLSADCIHWYAHLFEEDGRFDDGIRLMKQSVELEPLSAHYQWCLGMLFLNARQYDRAILEIQKVPELDSLFDISGFLYRCYFLKGEYDKAIDQVDRMRQKGHSDRVIELYQLGEVYASTGRKDDARNCIRKLYKIAGKQVLEPTFFASLYAQIGRAHV
jgi:TolB-like protein